MHTDVSIVFIHDVGWCTVGTRFTTPRSSVPETGTSSVTPRPLPSPSGDPDPLRDVEALGLPTLRRRVEGGRGAGQRGSYRRGVDSKTPAAQGRGAGVAPLLAGGVPPRRVCFRCGAPVSDAAPLFLKRRRRRRRRRRPRARARAQETRGLGAGGGRKSVRLFKYKI